MKISPVKITKINYNKPLNRIQKNKPEKFKNDFSFGSVSSQLQNIMLYKKQEEEYFEEFINRKGRVTMEEYEEISKKHPFVLMKAQKYCDDKLKMNISPQVMATIVARADKYLKMKYKNSRIISMGTSPAPLCEQLSMLGHDVIFVPVTGIRSLDVEKHNPEEIPALKYLIDYIKSKNIDDGKQNIVLDFTCTGMSLRAMRDLIKKYINVGEGNLKAVSLNDVLNRAFDDACLIEKLTLDAYFDSLFLGMPEDVSNVPHYEALERKFTRYNDKSFAIRTENKSEKEIFKEFENSSQPLARAYALCTMHEYTKLSERNFKI